jgi:hypothetical protein
MALGGACLPEETFHCSRLIQVFLGQLCDKHRLIGQGMDVNQRRLDQPRPLGSSSSPEDSRGRCSRVYTR